MSTQQALTFLQRLREDEKLRSTLTSRQDEVRLGELVAIGADFGLVFDEAQLRDAFSADWGLRALLSRRSRLSA